MGASSSSSVSRWPSARSRGPGRRRCRSAGPAGPAARARPGDPVGRAEQGQRAGAALAGHDPGVRDGGVDGVLGHPAVGRQLAADDRHDAGAAGEDGVPPRDVGGLAGPPGSSSGRSPAKAPDHVGAVDGALEGGRHHVEEEADLGLGRLGHVRDRAVGRLVGEPDVDGAVGLGQDQHEPVEGAGDGCVDDDPQPRERLLAQHEVGAAAGPQLDLVDQVAGPHAGGVDDGAGGDAVARAGELVAQLDRGAGRGPRGRGCARARRTTRRCGRPSSPTGRRPRAGRPSRASRRGGLHAAARGRAAAPRSRRGGGGGAASARWSARRDAAGRPPRSPPGPRRPGAWARWIRTASASGSHA